MFGFLGFPTWYQYLPQNGGNPSITGINDIWLIVAAVVDILLHVAALVAVVMIIYGGFEFIISQGDAERAKSARSTIINGLIGLVIAVAAATLVSFIAGRFKGA